jgi:hypothetical protein
VTSVSQAGVDDVDEVAFRLLAQGHRLESRWHRAVHPESLIVEFQPAGDVPTNTEFDDFGAQDTTTIYGIKGRGTGPSGFLGRVRVVDRCPRMNQNCGLKIRLSVVRFRPWPPLNQLSIPMASVTLHSGCLCQGSCRPLPLSARSAGLAPAMQSAARRAVDAPTDMTGRLRSKKDDRAARWDGRLESVPAVSADRCGRQNWSRWPE